MTQTFCVCPKYRCDFCDKGTKEVISPLTIGPCHCISCFVVLTSGVEELLLILYFLNNIHVVLWHIQLKILLQLWDK